MPDPDRYAYFQQPTDTENQGGDQAQPGYAAPEDTEGRPTQFIPYRGAEQHGIAFTTEIPFDPDMTGIVNPETSTVLVEPQPEAPEVIPVPVVDVSESPDVRRMFVATSIVIPAAPLHPSQTAPRLLNRRQNRTKAKITIKRVPGATLGPDRLWITESESPTAATGSFPLDTGETFETNTTEDVYGILDVPTNGALVCIYEEYEIPA
jgi:hypothetical protein